MNKTPADILHKVLGEELFLRAEAKVFNTFLRLLTRILTLILTWIGLSTNTCRQLVTKLIIFYPKASSGRTTRF